MLVSAMAMLAGVAQFDPSPGFKGSRKDAELAMAEFAACEVRSDRGKAAALAFTREVAGTPSEYPKRLMQSSCARRGTTLRFNPVLFRMSLFPALYARDYGAAAPAIDVATVPAADYTTEFDGTPSAETVAIRSFGDCVVRRDPAISREFVLSKPYSKTEAAVLERFKPVFGMCLPEGRELRFSRSVAHGAIGEALYKLTAATAATKAS